VNNFHESTAVCKNKEAFDEVGSNFLSIRTKQKC
jgi:hypothetical protein